MKLETVWLLFEIVLATGAVQLASPVEYRSESACLRRVVWGNSVGTFGALDQRVFVCRRVNREKSR